MRPISRACLGIVSFSLGLGAASPALAAGGPMAETWYGKPLPEKHPKHHIAMPDGSIDGATIRLERDICYGFCPAYSIELSGDGRVNYKGRGFILIHGPLAYRIQPEVVRALVDKARAADFWSLDNSYHAPVTDHATIRISVTIGGQTKTIVDYVGRDAGMPIAVSELEDAVDAAAGAERWVDGTASTLADLRAAGWDFHSQLAGQVLADAAREAPEAFVIGLISAGAPLGELASSEYWPNTERSTLQNACANSRMDIVRALVVAGALKVTPANVDLAGCLEKARP